MQITTIGIDLAKTVFQIHAVDSDGATVIRKRLRRAEVLSFLAGLEPCLIGMEACATSHYWARELTKFGHTVKLMPPAYVKPYVKRGKNDATDAEAICEAVTRPNMRFVPVKSADQQAVLMLHRTRALLIRQQTMLANAFRAHLAEFGIVVAQGIRHVRAHSDCKSRRSKKSFSPGIGQVKKAGGWKRSPAWGLLRRRPSPRQGPIPRTLDRAGSFRLGWG